MYLFSNVIQCVTKFKVIAMSCILILIVIKELLSFTARVVNKLTFFTLNLLFGKIYVGIVNIYVHTQPFTKLP